MLSSCLALVVAASPGLQMEQGTQTLVEIAPGAKVTVQHPAVLETRTVGEGQLLFIANSTGKTKVTSTGRDGKLKTWTVVVTPNDPGKVTEARALLRGIPGLQLVDGRCPMFACDSCNLADSERVETVMGLYPCIGGHPTVSETGDIKLIEKAAREMLGESPDATPKMELTYIDRRFHLTGAAVSEADVERLFRFRAAFPQVRIRVVLPP